MSQSAGMQRRGGQIVNWSCPGARVGVTPLMTERVTRCHGVKAADTYHAKGMMGEEEEEDSREC